MNAIYLGNDDSKMNGIKGILDKKNVNLDYAQNVTQALRNLLTSRFELIISELKLKDLDAYDLIKLMRKFNLTLPVIVLDENTNDLERALIQNEGGFDLVNSKDLNNLSDAVEQILVVA